MEPLAVAAALTLDEPFRFDRGLAKRLRMREVNAKEAFTLRDASGSYFRASLAEYDEKGGRAVAYERMGRSPEPTVDVTLACAVLARQRMHTVVQKATELGVRRIVPLLTDHSVPPDAVGHQQAHAWPGCGRFRTACPAAAGRHSCRRARRGRGAPSGSPAAAPDSPASAACASWHAGTPPSRSSPGSPASWRRA